MRSTRSLTRRIEKQKDTIADLKRQIRIRDTLIRNLSKLAYHPQQDPYRIGLVKRAKTRMDRRAAGKNPLSRERFASSPATTAAW